MRIRGKDRERERPDRDKDYVSLIDSGELLQCNCNVELRANQCNKIEHGYNDSKTGGK